MPEGDRAWRARLLPTPPRGRRHLILASEKCGIVQKEVVFVLTIAKLGGIQNIATRPDERNTRQARRSDAWGQYPECCRRHRLIGERDAMHPDLFPRRA